MPIIIRGVERLFIVCFGGLSVYQGYKLFMAGFTNADSSMEASGGKSRKLKLTRIAPGIFFALFGATILVVSLLRPLDINGPTKRESYLNLR